jgi:hypothetical protein
MLSGRACGRREDAEHDTVVDPRRVVPHEQQIGQRPDHHREPVGREPCEQRVDSPVGKLERQHATHQDVEQLLHRALPQGGVEPGGHPLAGDGRADDAIDHRSAHGVVGEGLPEQVAQVQHLDAAGAQDAGEAVVLLLCPLEPQHVVEEQGFAVVGCDAGDLDAGPVHHDGAQPPDLGGHAGHGGHGGTRWRCERLQSARHRPGRS